MEQEPFETEIERESPVLEIGINIAGEKIVKKLHYGNTLLVFHSKEYAHFDHIYVNDEDLEQPIVLFKNAGVSEETMKQINDLEFDAVYKKFPSIEDEQVFWEMQNYLLDQELNDPDNF